MPLFYDELEDIYVWNVKSLFISPSLSIQWQLEYIRKASVVPCTVE